MFGLLNLNKPAGCTSRDLVTDVARLAGRSVKVGHAGTLDPIATGVLVVCVGPATRLVPLIHEHQKSYEAEFQLGFRSDTDDTEVDLEAVDVPPGLGREQMAAALPEFTGQIMQVPPIYSAVKVNGKRAYKAARQGIDFELTAREVTVSRLELKDFAPPQFVLSIDCGTGTYIRSIGRDLARRLGTQAVMSGLIRTQVGPFHVSNALDVGSLTRANLREALISPLVMLNHLRKVTINDEQNRLMNFGQSLLWPDDLPPAVQPQEPLAILNSDGQLLAIAAERHGKIAPQIVIRTAERAS